MDENQSNLSLSLSENENENENENESRFDENLEYVEFKPFQENTDSISEFEIINESKFKVINNRYRKQTWPEYFRKLYMVSVILIISIVIYFYYTYKKSDILSKL